MMSNAAKVHEFLNKAQTFYFLTTDGDQPKGRPFGFQMLVDDVLYFGCGTFKNVFKQLTAALYDKNGWEMGLFCLENGHAEIRGMLDLKEEFDV